MLALAPVPRKLPVEVFDKNIKAIRALPALPPLFHIREKLVFLT
jgi:hypothetical protein